MDNFQTVASPSSLLLCKDSETSLDEEEEEEGRDEFASIIEGGDDEEEYIRMLVDKEITGSGIPMQEFLHISGDDWIRRARFDGIHYILKKRDFLGFRFQTAYLSVAYLDRFLSGRSIGAEKSWAIRLLSMACLSLAAKMEECVVPPLSDFCSEDFNFENRVIQRMELLVLNTLEWKMRTVTPFAFIHFFLKKFHGNCLRNEVSIIADVILAATRGEKIMRRRPSVIAAAATLVALDETLTRDDLEFRISPLTSMGVLKIEEFISCYYEIQEVGIEKLKLNQEIKSPDLSPVQLHRTEAYGSSSASHVGGGKRKRLEFNQSVQTEDASNNKQKH